MTDYENWRILLRKKVAADILLKVYLVEKFLDRGTYDLDEAVYWTNEFCAEHPEFEDKLSHESMTNIEHGRSNGRGQLETMKKNYVQFEDDSCHKLSLQKDKIVFVNDANLFQQMVEYLSEQVRMIFLTLFQRYINHVINFDLFST